MRKRGREIRREGWKRGERWGLQEEREGEGTWREERGVRGDGWKGRER